MSHLKSWERQENESVQAYEAFAIYRSLGNKRTLVAVEETLNKSHALIGRWSSKHQWVDRVREWDNWLLANQLVKPEAIDDMREFQERAKETARQMQMVGSAAITGAISSLTPYIEKDAQGRRRELEPRDAIALLREGVRLKQVGLDAEAQAIGAAEILDIADEIRDTLSDANSGTGG